MVWSAVGAEYSQLFAQMAARSVPPVTQARLVAVHA
jgi:hypothetical protein